MLDEAGVNAGRIPARGGVVVKLSGRSILFAARTNEGLKRAIYEYLDEIEAPLSGEAVEPVELDSPLGRK